MAPEIVRLRPGPTATAYLVGRLRAVQAGDPLQPVTVVVPTHHAGLFLRRRLAAEGYANVRFTILPRLAEALGASTLTARGHSPLSSVTRAALMRTALRSAGPPLAASADDAGLVAIVARLATELRRRADPAGDADRIRVAGLATSRAAMDAVISFEMLRAQAALYDDVDLLDEGASGASKGTATDILRELGAVIVHLPSVLDPPDLRFLRSLADHQSVVVTMAELAESAPSEPEPAIPVATISAVIALDPVAEVRAAARDILSAAEGDQAVPLHRTAIVYRDEQTYGGLLRDTLGEANIPFASLDGRRLSGTVAARGLLGLIRLRDQDFSRSSVLAWLAGLPHSTGVLRSQARWDELSRDAGVVRGVTQWRDRLTLLAEGRARTLERLQADPEDDIVEARQAALRRDIDDARRIVEHVEAFDMATAPPALSTWEAHVAWAFRLRDEFLTPDAAWSAEDREAAQAVEEVVRSLAAAEAVEPTVSIGVFLRALEDGLETRRRPEGRLGHGVVVGPHHLLLGMDMARVHVLGVVEGSFPSPAPVDPLLPGDPLDRRATREMEERRDWLAALAAADGGEVIVSAPMVDADGRSVYPSPWLLELLADNGSRPRASDVRAGTVDHPQLRRVGALAGDGTALLSIAERREVEASAEHAAHGTLLHSPLAGRDDLPFGRLLTLKRARHSSELTEFDGNVAAVADLPLIARGLCGPVQSATGVETWATCPFHFLLGRVLAVRPTVDVEDDRWWQIDAAERGTLVHGILERFFSEVAATGHPGPGTRYTDEDVRRIETIADSAFGDAQSRGIVGHPLVWANERAAILADLRTILREDADHRMLGSWRPRHLEQPFGADGDERSWPSLSIPLGDGRAVLLRGFIDRVDIDDAGNTRVIDYKTGRNRTPEVGVDTLFDGGRKLQLPVYGRVVRDHMRAQGIATSATMSLYWFATVRGNFDQVALAVDQSVEEALTDVLTRMDSGVRAGCFPQVPGEFAEWSSSYDNCGYCDYDSLCPAGRDVLAAAKAASQPLAPYRALQPQAAEDDA